MATLGERVDALERTNVAYDLLLKALEKQDTQTAASVDHLAEVIKDPKVGLIVTLDRYQEAAKSDRRTQLAFFAGLVVVVNIIIAVAPTVLRVLFP